MHTNEDPSPLTNLGYEPQDFKNSQIVKAAAWFFVFAIFSSVAAAFFLYFFGKNPIPPTPQRAFVTMTPPPGTPILQTNVTNTEDIITLRRKENEELSTTGKTAEPGFYHIPIDRAIDLVAQRGLPKIDGRPPTQLTAPADPASTSPSSMTPGGTR